MLKGKLKKKGKKLSVFFVSDSHRNIKVLRFSALYSRLPFVMTVLSIIVVSISLFVGYTFYQNSQLKSEQRNMITNISNLTDLNRQKNNEIQDLKQTHEDTDKQIKEFTNKYREITDNYITTRSDGTKVNRSGDRNDRSFITDINDLKVILTNLEKQQDSVDGENFTETEKKLKEYSDSIPTLWPVVGRISSEFGGRKDPFQYREKFHAGIDIAANYGQDIVAAGNGKVVYANWYAGYGYLVIISHGYGITTLYGHNSRLMVKEGLTVNKGDVIAKAGSSGQSTGVHSHFEVRINETPVDPLKYLEKR